MQPRRARLGDVFEMVLGADWRTCPPWPVDLFAATATALRLSGAYTRIVELRDDDTPCLIDTATWPETALALGRRWRTRISRAGPLPSPPREVAAWWRRLVAASELLISEIRHRDAAQHDEHDDVCRDLLRTCCVADVACEGIDRLEQGDDRFFDRAAGFWLAQRAQSFCSPRVDPTYARVLPKRHTPQRGLTLRSLSHHLALLSPSEVEAIWTGAWFKLFERRDIFSILALPWPLTIEPRSFSLAPMRDHGSPTLAAPFRFFRFGRRGQPERLRSYLLEAIARARRTAATVNIIVFPELALTPDEFEVARAIARDERCMLVAGVATPGGTSRRPGPAKNEAAVALPWNPTTGEPMRLDRQQKHHRWCLDRSQIQQYGLHGELPTSLQCWEHTTIGPRRVKFWSVDSWLTFTVLICEDLARQDPVADVVRSVGPNLIFALLMDGPQLQKRWGAKYASVLAEDPGCSVLTLTSLGMSRLSQSLEANVSPRSGVVALWRDAINGACEIELQGPQNAALLNIVCSQREEFTCDGRGDGGTTDYPTLAGWTALEIPMPPG